MTKDKTTTRLATVQALYLYEINNQDAELALMDVTHYYIKDNPLEEYELAEAEKIKLIDKSYLSKLFTQTIANLEAIDAQITQLLTKQESVQQLDSILRAILRVSICELQHFSTPYKVVIDEYVTLAREFYTANEVNFINGILDKIANS